MARDITLSVIARENARRALGDAADAFDDLSTRARESNRRINDSAYGLRDGIARTRMEIERLQQRYDQTGDSSYLTELSERTGRLTQMTGLLRGQLRDIDIDINVDRDRVGREMEWIAGAATRAGVVGGEQILTSIESGIGGAFDALPAEAKVGAMAAGATIATTMAPMIGAALSGAVLGGVGTGGLIAGIAAAAQDGRVSAAWDRLTELAKGKFTAAGQQFVDPVLDGIDILDDAFAGIDVSGLLAPMAGTVEPLARGLAEMARQALPGIQSMMRAAAPVIERLAATLPDIGRALDIFGEQLGATGEEGAHAMGVMVEVVATLIVMVGDVIRGLAEMYGFLMDLGDAAADVAGAIGDGIDDLGDTLGDGVTAMGEWAGVTTESASAAQIAEAASHDLAGALRSNREAASEAASGTVGLGVEIRKTTAAMQDQVEMATSLIETEMAYEEALDSLTESLKKNKGAWDTTNEAGREHIRSLLSAADAAKAEYEANIASGMSAEEAARRYQAQIATLEKKARAAGATTDEINRMLGAYRSVPGNVDTRVSAIGVNGAREDVIALKKAIDSIDRSVGVSVNVAVKGAGLAALPRRAAGGPVKAGQPYVVGDGGKPELFVPTQSGMILPEVPRSTPRGMPVSGGSGASGGQVTIHLSVASLDPRQSADLVMDALKQWQRSNGPLPVRVSG